MHSKERGHLRKILRSVRQIVHLIDPLNQQWIWENRCKSATSPDSAGATLLDDDRSFWWFIIIWFYCNNMRICFFSTWNSLLTLHCSVIEVVQFNRLILQYIYMYNIRYISYSDFLATIANVDIILPALSFSNTQKIVSQSRLLWLQLLSHKNSLRLLFYFWFFLVICFYSSFYSQPAGGQWTRITIPRSSLPRCWWRPLTSGVVRRTIVACCSESIDWESNDWDPVFSPGWHAK